MAKTILITGCSSGIGHATALYFAERGWNVAATMRDPAKADDRLKQPNIFITPLDVTDDTSIEVAIAAVQGRFGTIDALLNNAGYGLFGALEAMSAEQIDRQLRTNVYGLIHTTQSIIPVMRAQGSGIILNVASIGGRMGGPYQSLYCATKFAVEGLSESLRYELSKFNISVKIIEPGGIKTDFATRSLTVATNDMYRASTDKAMSLVDKFSKSMPGPEHVAKVIYRAATDQSHRLRYLAKPGAFILLKWLPDRVMRWLLLKAI